MTSTGHATKVAYRVLKNNGIIKMICDKLNGLEKFNKREPIWYEDTIMATKVTISGNGEDSKIRIMLTPVNEDIDLLIEYREYLYSGLGTIVLYLPNHQIALDVQKVNLYKTIVNSMYVGG